LVIILADVDFNITGTILESNDPLNLYIENIFIDAYNLRNAFYILTFCNYPGAFKGGDVFAKNITVTMSSRKNFVLSTSIIFSLLLGDFTIDGMFFDKFYMDLAHQTSAMIAFVFPGWVPDEPKARKVTFKNIDASIWYPDNQRELYLTLAVGEINPNVVTTTEFSNIYFHDIYGANLWGISITWGPQSTFYYHDSVNDNTIFDMSMVLPQYCKQVTLQNITFQNTHGVQHQLFSSDSSQSLIIRDIRFKNITGSESPVAPIFHFKDLATTQVELSGFSVEDSTILKSDLLKNTLEFDRIFLEHVYFSNVTVASEKSLILFENFNYFEFDNHTYIGISNSDSINTQSSIIRY
jgi:hypothetical protein